MKVDDFWIENEEPTPPVNPWDPSINVVRHFNRALVTELRRHAHSEWADTEAAVALCALDQ